MALLNVDKLSVHRQSAVLADRQSPWRSSRAGSCRRKADAGKHKIIVMYAGQVVETGDAHAIFHAPRHPYTQALLRALPEFAQDKERLASLPGVVPGKYDRPNGCLLNPRCPYATDRCRAEEPALNMLADGRQSKCHYPLDDAGRPTL